MITTTIQVYEKGFSGIGAYPISPYVIVETSCNNLDELKAHYDDDVQESYPDNVVVCESLTNMRGDLIYKAKS